MNPYLTLIRKAFFNTYPRKVSAVIVVNNFEGFQSQEIHTSPEMAEDHFNEFIKEIKVLQETK